MGAYVHHAALFCEYHGSTSRIVISATLATLCRLLKKLPAVVRGVDRANGIEWVTKTMRAEPAVQKHSRLALDFFLQVVQYNTTVSTQFVTPALRVSIVRAAIAGIAHNPTDRLVQVGLRQTLQLYYNAL
jgi:hypothetical protein